MGALRTAANTAYQNGVDVDKALVRPLFSTIEAMAPNLYPEAYGATGNAVIFEDGAISSGSPNFTSSSSTFTSADIGKKIVIMGAGTSGATKITTISSITNSHTVVIASNASTTVSAAHGAYGTDDATAYANYQTAVGPGVGFHTPGKKYLTGTAQITNAKRLYGCGATIIFAIPNNTNNCWTHNPPGGTNGGSFYGCQDLDFEYMATGLDGRKLTANVVGTPEYVNCYSSHAYRDNRHLFVAADTGIEKSVFDRDRGYYSGRNFCTITVTEAVSGISFCNHIQMRQCEARGIGRRYTDSNGFSLIFDAVTDLNSKVSMLQFDGGIYDCLYSQAMASGVGDFIMVRKINSATHQRVERVIGLNTIVIETSDGATISPLKKVINMESGVETPLFCELVNRTYGNWCESYHQNILDEPLNARVGAHQAVAWTPTLVGSSVAGTNTYDTPTAGWYIDLGWGFLIEGYILLSAKDGTMSGNISVGGLPFTVGSDHMIPCRTERITYTAGTIRLRPSNNTKTILLVNDVEGAPGTGAAITHTAIQNTTLLQFSGTILKKGVIGTP